MPTKDNSADLLTKVLPYADYCRHRARMMNLSTLPKVPRADYDAARWRARTLGRRVPRMR